MEDGPIIRTRNGRRKVATPSDATQVQKTTAEIPNNLTHACIFIPERSEVVGNKDKIYNVERFKKSRITKRSLNDVSF